MLPAEPQVEISTAERCVRGTVVLLGGIGLFVVCGPWRISKGILVVLDLVSIGSRSWWAAFQGGVWIIMIMMFLLVLWLTDRKLRRLDEESPERRSMKLRQNWWLAAVTSWAMCLITGLSFSWLAIETLA